MAQEIKSRLMKRDLSHPRLLPPLMGTKDCGGQNNFHSCYGVLFLEKRCGVRCRKDTAK